MAAESSTSSLKAVLKRLAKQYELAVVRDPSFATRIELGLKISSYLIPGKLSSWKHLSELAFTLSNLFTIFNDYLIIKQCPTASPVNKLTVTHRHLLWSISVLECIEVLTEVGSEYFWRDAGKWFIVLILRLLKLVLQCIAVLKYKSHILSSPAVPCIDRKKVNYVSSDVIPPPEGRSVAYTGRRTGTVIRSLYADPTIPYSDLPVSTDDDNTHERSKEMDTSSRPPLSPRTLEPNNVSSHVIAELLHIARPIVHIVSMMKFNESSWKPWLIALTMDILSLHLHGGLLKFNKSDESSEILRRRLVLLLYLLRSPFYDRFSKDILHSVLYSVSQRLPLAHYVIDPLLEYLPVWQQIYSYNWMS